MQEKGHIRGRATSQQTQRVAGPWNRLPREGVTAPTLTELKKCLDNTLRHMVGFLGLSYAGPGVVLQ